MCELKAGISSYFRYYNSQRLHQGLDYTVPDERYQSFRSEKTEHNNRVCSFMQTRERFSAALF